MFFLNWNEDNYIIKYHNNFAIGESPYDTVVQNIHTNTLILVRVITTYCAWTEKRVFWFMHTANDTKSLFLLLLKIVIIEWNIKDLEKYALDELFKRKVKQIYIILNVKHIVGAKCI